MFTPEEQQYMELGTQFRDELAHIDKQIDELQERRNQLLHVLYGPSEDRIAEDEPASNDEEAIYQVHDPLTQLVLFLKENPGAKRGEIVELFDDVLDAKQISRLLEKGRKRGVIHSKGQARASRWYAKR